MSRRAKPANLLDHKKASVSVHRNGLTMEMQGVPADQLEAVAAVMLNAMRRLVKAGYGEMVVDGGSVYATPLGEVEEHPVADAKRVGF